MESLLDKNVSVYTACAGVGAEIPKELWVIGCSKFLVGSQFLYDRSTTDEFLGFAPESYSSAETAMELAMASYRKAFLDDGREPIGLGVTGTVASNRIFKGGQRVHLAVMCSRGLYLITREFDPKSIGEVARKRQDRQVVLMSRDLISTATNGYFTFTRELIQDVTAEGMELVLKRPVFEKHDRAYNISNYSAILPGTFNPPHEGHVAMARDSDAVFNLTIDPPHKTEVHLSQVLKRVKLCRNKGVSMYITKGDPLYLDKAKNNPGRVLVMGADSFQRMLDPEWCEDSYALLKEFSARLTRFEVAPRLIDGELVGLWDIIDNDLASKLPPDMFYELNVRADISSTELREKA